MSLICKNLILKCYELSREYHFLHEWFRQLVLALEVPLLKFFFRLTLKSHSPLIIIRHSLLEAYGFNLFMSDIDLTLEVHSPEHVSKVLHSYHLARKIFINLGEPEVLSRSERKAFLDLESPQNEALWNNLFQLRKLSWQNKKLSMAQTFYEKAKVQRGIARTLYKLKSKDRLLLENIFPDCPESHEAPLHHFPHYSVYLERWIETTPSNSESLLCPNTAKANGFLKMLPGYEAEEALNKLKSKRYFAIREICLSISQLRILVYQNKESDHLVAWIKKLEEQSNIKLLVK